MKSHRAVTRVSRSWWVLLAAAGLGAGPADPWQGIRAPLPPVVDGPRAASQLPPPVQGRPVAAAALPASVPARPAMPALTPTPMSVQLPPVAGVPQYVSAPNTRVYVINGLDPFGWGGLSQMADRIRDSGYPDTRFGAWFQVLQFDREIRQMHRQDPSAQVVIIGYSLGVYRARALASRLQRDGIPVAMVGYIGGDYLRNSPVNMPNGARVVNVTGDGYLLTGRNLFFNGTELSGADNVRMPGVRHFSLPKQEQTLNALVNGINTSTGRGGWAPAVAASPSGVPGGIAVGPEVIPQPAPSAYSPTYATGRR